LRLNQHVEGVLLEDEPNRYGDGAAGPAAEDGDGDLALLLKHLATL
jgi:hypothetical protein